MDDNLPSWGVLGGLEPYSVSEQGENDLHGLVVSPQVDFKGKVRDALEHGFSSSGWFRLRTQCSGGVAAHGQPRSLSEVLPKRGSALA